MHEFQHSKLYATNDLFQLYSLESEQIYYAPWRQDPRPVDGLCQGVYAFLGITSFWEVNRRKLTGNDYLRSCFEFARWRYLVAAALDVVVAPGHLTEVGHEFARGMRKTVTVWHEQSVPETPQRLADQVAAEHRVVWRLANLRPDTAAISALADSWAAGADRPSDSSRVTTVTETDEERRGNSRLELFRLRLARPDEFARLCADRQLMAEAGFSDITEADIAYLRDEFAEARIRYNDDITREPDRYQHWAGLAVACRAESLVAGDVLQATPEVVFAVHQEIRRRTSTAPDPTEVAAWLAPAFVPVP